MKEGWKPSRLLSYFIIPDDAHAPDAQAAQESGKLMAVEQLAPQAPTFARTLEVPAGQTIKFEDIYRAASIQSDNRFTAEKALEMITRFPAELPLETRRMTARVALEAMGKTDREVLTDAAEKIRALEAYVATGAAEVKTVEEEADSQIAKLETQIQEWKQIKKAKRVQQEELDKLCNAQADELEKVVDFFTPDVPAPESKPVA